MNETGFTASQGWPESKSNIVIPSGARNLPVGVSNTQISWRDQPASVRSFTSFRMTAVGSKLLPLQIYFSEFDSSFLHFAIRQQPDQGFIVKIDNLNPIAPGVAKIAAERRLEFQFVFFG